MKKEEIECINKDEFIGNYINKAMSNHGLPYGLSYFNLRTEVEEKAERAWKRLCKKYSDSNKLIEKHSR